MKYSVMLFDYIGSPYGRGMYESGRLQVSSLEDAEKFRAMIVPNGWAEIIAPGGEVVQVLREGTENYQC